MTDWYLARSKCHRESQALANLARQGIEAYYPAYLGEALFVGYLFIASAEEGFAAVQCTPGVLGLVRYGEQLAKAPPGLVDMLKATDWHRSEDCASGTRVRITEGPFEHLQGIVKFKSADRITILMKVMHSEQALTFPIQAVEAA